jgi:DNA-binding response OmpR family regulator
MQTTAQSNHPARILVIDDDEGMRTLLKDFLEEEGFETECASSGFDALQEVAGRHFDLIITDIGMPGLTGLDILPKIRRLRPGAPIIVMSSFASRHVRRRSLEEGAMGCLEKPIRIEKLRKLVHHHLERRRVADGE